MHAIRVASAALLTATVLTLTIPPASAAVTGDENNNNITSFGFRVTPSTIAAGGQVTLSVDGCEGDTKVTSGIFDDAHIPKGQTSTTAHVFWDAKPGAMYEVTFDCKGEIGKTDLTIATGRPDNNGHQNPDQRNPNQQNPVHKGVKAGVGGSFGGLDLHEIALGGALILGAVGTAYYKARRRTGESNS
ncbi:MULTISPECIES: hypothetical protein [unclassified Streptomyces]|uniref:hypothetical protein n=1 Tax=unclassified Streptomyces TaxID=2593676 RepID=UPI001CC155D5|nr:MULTISPECIES: hypothetical protein [unclassified Streptomyces]WPO69584.1 hypothetical protein R9806_02515 [Streptomyces sp. KN37]